jgi:hypothetical protein
VSRGTLLTLVAVAGFFVLLWLGARDSTQIECEVCMRYAGRVQCRTVLGATEKEAAAGAVMNACGFLTSGVTDTIRCQNTRPESVVCRER